MPAADLERQDHRVQPDERGGQPRVVTTLLGYAPHERHGGQACRERDRLERPHRAGDPERHEHVGKHHEQRPVRRLLVVPAQVGPDRVVRRRGRSEDVRVEMVDLRQPGEPHVAEDVGRQQRRREQEQHVRRHDRRDDDARREAAHAREHGEPRAEQRDEQPAEPGPRRALAEPGERPREPVREVAHAARHEERRRGGGVEDEHDRCSEQDRAARRRQRGPQR